MEEILYGVTNALKKPSWVIEKLNEKKDYNQIITKLEEQSLKIQST